MKTTLLKDRLPGEPILAFTKRVKANTSYLAERKSMGSLDWHDSLPFSETYDKYSTQVSQWVQAALSRNDMENHVEDVTQEVWLAVHRYLDTYKGDSSLKTWLYKVTENCVAGYITSIREERDMFKELPEYDDIVVDNFDPIDDTTPTPEAALEAKQELGVFFKSLSDQERQVFLYYVDGHTADEISSLTELTVKGVEKTIERIQAKTGDFPSKQDSNIV